MRRVDLRHPAVAPALLGLAVAAANLAFLPRYAVNWDNVNFLLGVDAFDVLHHQPHPPGYIGYVVTGRWLAAVLGDPQLALTGLSAVSAGAGTAGVVVLARRMVAHPWPLVAGALFGSSPLVLYYGRVGLTYAVAAALAVWTVVAAHRARREGSLPSLLGAVVLLAVLGSIRQTDLVMLLPLLAYAGWRFRLRDQVAAVGLLGVLTLGWLVPLIASTGGLEPYLEESAALAAYAGGRTNLLGMQLAGLVQNVSFVLVGLAIGLCAAVALAVRRRGATAEPALHHDDRRVLLLWAVPSLLVFLVIHTGQVGYVLLVLPPVLLAVVARAAAVAPTAAPRLTGLTAGLVAVNVVAFLLAPPTVHAVARGDGRVADLAEAVSGDGQGWQARTRQYDLAANDRYWEELLAHVDTVDPATTAVVTSLSAGSSFRHLAYYLDRHWLVGLGLDLEGEYRELFAGRGHIEYSVQALEDASPVVRLPEGITHVLLVADDASEALDPSVPRTYERLDSGTRVALAAVPTGRVLEVCEGPDDTLALIPTDGEGCPA